MLLMGTYSLPTKPIQVLYGRWLGHPMERGSPLAVEAAVLNLLITRCECGRESRIARFACLLLFYLPCPRSFMLRQVSLAQADILWGDLNQFIVIDEVKRLLQAHEDWRR